MNPHEFQALLQRFTQAAEAGDGQAFAACFTADATYHDYIYDDHHGRADTAHMLVDLFRRDAGPDYRWGAAAPRRAARRYNALTIARCGMPASSNSAPCTSKPARR